jgi:hypothetical protein
MVQENSDSDQVAKTVFYSIVLFVAAFVLSVAILIR